MPMLIILCDVDFITGCSYIPECSDMFSDKRKLTSEERLYLLPNVKLQYDFRGLSLLQTSKFSMTSFYVTSFICLSVRATLTIFSMTSALAQKLAC